MIEHMEFELSKEYLERFTEAVDAKEADFVTSTLDGVNPADISEVIRELDAEQTKFVIDLLDVEIGAEIIVNLEEDRQSLFLENFTADELATFVDQMDSDDGVDVINELPIEKREEVIASVENEEKAGYILDLLRYEEDVAGGLMAKEMICANLNWTIQQCIEEIRKQAENVEKIYSVYVVDNDGKLLGR
ncbi:MAG: magnesium transporter, partial [Reichenbachiella sp.]